MIIIGLYKSKIYFYSNDSIIFSGINISKNSVYVSYVLDDCFFNSEYDRLIYWVDLDRIIFIDRCVAYVGKYALACYLEKENEHNKVLTFIDNYNSEINHDYTSGPIEEIERKEYIYMNYLMPKLTKIYTDLIQIKNEKDISFNRLAKLILVRNTLEKIYSQRLLNFINSFNMLPSNDEYLVFIITGEIESYINYIETEIKKNIRENADFHFFISLFLKKIRSRFITSSYKMFLDISLYSKKNLIIYSLENENNIKNIDKLGLVKIKTQFFGLNVYAKKLNKKDSMMLFHKSYIKDYYIIESSFKVNFTQDYYLTVDKISLKRDLDFYLTSTVYEQPKEIIKEIMHNDKFEAEAINFIRELVRFKKNKKSSYIKLFNYSVLLGLYYKYGGQIEYLDSFFIDIKEYININLLDFTNIEKNIDEENFMQKINGFIKRSYLEEYNRFFVIVIYRISYKLKDINTSFIFVHKYYSRIKPKNSKPIEEVDLGYMNYIKVKRSKYEFYTCIRTYTDKDRDELYINIFMT